MTDRELIEIIISHVTSEPGRYDLDFQPPARGITIFSWSVQKFLFGPK